MKNFINKPNPRRLYTSFLTLLRKYALSCIIILLVGGTIVFNAKAGNFKICAFIFFAALQIILLYDLWILYKKARHFFTKKDIFPLTALTAVYCLACTAIYWEDLIFDYSIVKFEFLLAVIWSLYAFFSYKKIPGLGALLGLGTYFAWLFSFFAPFSFAGLGAFISVFVGGALLICFTLSWLNTAFKYIFKFFICALWGVTTLALNLASLYVYKMGNKGLNSDEMSAVFQTNLRESIEFIFSFFSSGELLGAIAVAGLCSWLLYKGLNASGKKHIKFTAFGGIILVGVGVCLSVFNNPVAQLTSNIQRASQNYRRTAQEYKYYQDLRKHNHPLASKKQTGELYVLVIGESSNPHHWSAYGYFRDTTPFAKDFFQHPNVLFFNRAYTSFVHTVPALTLALTQANQYNKENAFKEPSIIEVAKAAGFKTFWLSNQDKISLVDNPLTILAQAADKTVFTNQSRFRGDETLLPLLQETLKEINPKENNLIVLHLIGSHAKYQVRYPRSFKKDFPSGEEFLGTFAGNKKFVQNILNPYDNTIAYTDYILSQIYKQIESVPVPVKAFIFFSDHGEDVYAQKFHNSKAFTFDMARIPLFMWFSAQYQQQYPHIKQTLSAHTNHIFTLDTLYDTLLGILGIDTPHMSAQYDFSSPLYAITAENALTMYTDETLQSNLYAPSPSRKISQDPNLQAIDNLEQITKSYPFHLVANYTDPRIKTYQAIRTGFTGLEVNVTAPSLMIGHGPQHVYHISLEEFLASLPNQEEFFFWLDIKMLKEKDTQAVLERLEKIDKKFHIKNRCVLETPLRAESLVQWAQKGWKTALYLFYEDPNQQTILSTPQLAKEYAAKAALDVKKQQAFAVSFPAEIYPFVKEYLEPQLAPDTRYLTWALPTVHNISQENVLEKLALRPETKDKRLYALLLDS